MNHARLRTAASATAAALSLTIVPLIVESAWASSGGSATTSSNKRSNAHITRSGTEGAGSGASSDEDTDSARETGPSSNSKKAKSNTSNQKAHVKNTQAFQMVALEELKNHPDGLSSKDLTNKLVSAGTLVKKSGGASVTQGALSALEKKGAVEKVADSSPAKYRVTATGHPLTSLKRPKATSEELKTEIIELLSLKDNETDGLSLRSIFRRLGYADESINRHHGDLLGQMVSDRILSLTPEGRYILSSLPTGSS